MRKLKLQMQLSLDGYCAGPNGEMDWMTWNFDDHLKDYIKKSTEPVDCILLGRKLAEGFIPTWKDRLTEPAGEDPSFVKGMNDTPKIVFSKNYKTSDWENTTFTNNNIVTEIIKLKQGLVAILSYTAAMSLLLM